MVRTNMFTRFTAILAVIVLFAALISVAPFQTALAAEPDLTSFAVLGGPAVTLTGSTVNGNVGSLGAFTNTSSTINGDVHEGDQVAIDAYTAFVGEYAALAALPDGVELTGTLAGVTLTPGNYYFDAAAALTGTLTLDAGGDPNAVWIFKIGTSGTGALTGTDFNVVFKDNVGAPCNVYWWVAEAATLTTSNFQGTIFAGAAITVSYGAFNGNALAKAAVTLTGTIVGCSPWSVPVTPIPVVQLGSIKVTGGGQISVTDGPATFGFNAQLDKKGGAKGNLNYVNHVAGLHINGTVDNIMVNDINSDNSPKTVLFSGSYKGGSFIVTVQDNGEPGTNDQFGIWVTTVAGSQSEVTSMRVISNGNIQFHKQ
jgi:hypothetical protein